MEQISILWSMQKKGITTWFKLQSIIEPLSILVKEKGFDHSLHSGHSGCELGEDVERKAEWTTAMIGATLFIISSKG